LEIAHAMGVAAGYRNTCMDRRRRFGIDDPVVAVEGGRMSFANCCGSASAAAGPLQHACCGWADVSAGEEIARTTRLRIFTGKKKGSVGIQQAVIGRESTCGIAAVMWDGEEVLSQVAGC